MSDEITSQGPERSGINRRTVMKGAAWSVPVVMVASAAPALAYSGPVQLSGTACRHTGNSDGPDVFQDYHFTLQVLVPTGPCVNVTIDQVKIGGVAKPFCIGAYCRSSAGQGVTGPDATMGPVNLGCVAAGTTSYVLHVDSDSSANTTIDVLYTYGAGQGDAQGVTNETGCSFPNPSDY